MELSIIDTKHLDLPLGHCLFSAFTSFPISGNLSPDIWPHRGGDAPLLQLTLNLASFCENWQWKMFLSVKGISCSAQEHGLVFGPNEQLYNYVGHTLGGWATFKNSAGWAPTPSLGGLCQMIQHIFPFLFSEVLKISGAQSYPLLYCAGGS